MIEVKKEGVLLRKTNLDFENEGVLNPAVISDGDCIHVFYRAVSKGNYSTIGYCRLKEPLEDSNGRAIWALGYLLSIKNESIQDVRLIKEFANRLVQMYKHERSDTWRWFESYLTYANSLLPEAILCAWLATGDPVYKEIARTSFDFLLSKIFVAHSIKVISNKNWLYKEEIAPITIGGEQPIDVAYTVLALDKFYYVFKDEDYREKMETAFNWFLGNNHLHQVIYNPCTGGCYDGLEENYVNLNQGAESTISYLLARLTVDGGLPNRIRYWQKSNVREGYFINNRQAIRLTLA